MTPVPHTNIRGLSSEEAGKRQQLYGYNELPASKPRSLFSIILQVVREPMFILLVACGTLYMLLGDTGEGLMLTSSVIIIIVITFYQEKKTERALETLRELSSPRTLVIRDGTRKRIASRELVTGDMIVLREGDRIPADAVVIQALNLATDESLLTGESGQVLKSDQNSIFPERHSSLIYSGSLVVQGQGIAEVTATGTDTELGRIGKSLHTIHEEPTLLQKETRRMVKMLSILGFGVCILLIIVYGLSRHDWLNGLLAGLSLAMAMLPEEFMVVLTIFMTIGAWKIARQNVLTRKPASIETLGAVTVLCADKTGTLTQNKMSIRKCYSGRRVYENPEDDDGKDSGFYELLEYSILASQSNAFDPMEKSLVSLGEMTQRKWKYKSENLRLVKEYPLSSSLQAISRVYNIGDQSRLLVAAKGSPEAIMELCLMKEQKRKETEEQVKTFAAEGLRVIGVAYALPEKAELPGSQGGFAFTFSGLIAFEDPLRDNVIKSLEECYQAGIRVIIITGDYPVTAQAIARQMGLKNPSELITGSQLKDMTLLQLEERIKTTNVFARVVPEQKLLLVEALKNQGEIVAMTGDGINDAPALRAAHAGIAMGEKGTDVAREAAGLVLTDDNFSSIVSAIRSGRTIYDNMQKAMAYIFSVHIPIAGLTLIPVLFPSIPVLLFPLHIAFLELIIDPACALIFEGEKEEKDVMKRPPRDNSKPVFGPGQMAMSSVQGIFAMTVSLAIVFIYIKLGRPEQEIRSLAFTTLVISNLGLIFTNRSRTLKISEILTEKNPAVKWVTGGALAFLLSTLYIPHLRRLFHFDVLYADDLLVCLAAGVFSTLWFEGIKLLRRNKSLNSKPYPY